LATKNITKSRLQWDKKHNYKDEMRGVELEAEEELVVELAHALK